MTAAPEKSNLLRRLYAWTLHWAETPYALPALCFLSFIESSVFPLPPDLLLAPLCFSQPKKWLTYAFWCTVFSVLGGILGWVIGFYLWQWTSSFFFHYVPGFTQARFDKVGSWYQENAFWIIVAKGLTPIPYKLVTITAGVFKVSLLTLITASIFCRSGRFFLVAGLIRFLGPKAHDFIEKHLETTLLVTFVLLILGFFALKLLH
jgi:membrane protein YqaA with SNARE-associated domain